MSDEPTPEPLYLPDGPFTPDTKQSVESWLNRTMPSGARGVILAVADEKGARVAFARRWGGGWSLGAEAEKSWDGPISGQVMVQKTW